MIWGDLAHWEQEKSAFHPVLQEAIQFLLEMDLENAAVGSFPIQGEDMFAMVQQPLTVPVQERKSENHVKFVDVQYLINGEEELIVVARQSEGNEPTENRLDDRDYALYDKVQGENQLLLKPGMFAVFFPNDLHRPACSLKGEITLKKVVIKIIKRFLVYKRTLNATEPWIIPLR